MWERPPGRPRHVHAGAEAARRIVDAILDDDGPLRYGCDDLSEGMLAGWRRDRQRRDGCAGMFASRSSVITGLAHTALHVADVDAAVAWYRDVLGLTVLSPPYRMEGDAIDARHG